jgi:inhibitor of KinA sporulation pathway (predicted exonuclease)
VGAVVRKRYEKIRIDIRENEVFKEVDAMSDEKTGSHRRRFRRSFRSEEDAKAFEKIVMSLNEANIQLDTLEYWAMMEHIADYIAEYKP